MRYFVQAFLCLCMAILCGCETASPTRVFPDAGAADVTATQNILLYEAAADKDHDGVPTPQDCNDDDPIVYPGGYEFCDWQDNDCDGETDETWKSLWGGLYGTPCLVTDEQGCVSEGRWGCDMDHDWLACNAPPVTPTHEKCNGADDDCDGITDNGVGWPELGSVCTITAPPCTVPGVWSCDPYTEMPYCTADDIPHPETTCTEN